MRKLIVNANIITGDGKSILENHSLAIEGELIDGISDVPYPVYERAEQIINAGGGFLIPGLINHHTHCITFGPAGSANAQAALPKSRIVQNLNRHLLEGSTTVVNVDGLATMEEVKEAKGTTPVLIQTMSVHTPLHLQDAKLLNLGGLAEQHWISVGDMVKQGALGIGEVGGTSDPSYYGQIYIPILVEKETGVRISIEDAKTISAALFAQPLDGKVLSDLAAERGIHHAVESLKQLARQRGRHLQLATEACHEAATTAGKMGIPLLMHNSPQTKGEVLEFAKELKGLLVACHSNFLYKPQEAVEVARGVKKAGGWVDIRTGDFFGARQFRRNHATTLALLEEGLVDMISTDYVGGYWDSILRVLEYAVLQNVIDLPQAIALATGNVLEAIPNVAPNRGQIAEGKIADLAIVSQKSISEVNTVLIGGKVVVDEGKIRQGAP